MKYFTVLWLNMHCLLPQMWKGCILSILFFLQTLCQLVPPLNKDGGQPRAGLQVPAPGLPDPRDQKTDACRPTGQGKLYSKPCGWEGAILEEGDTGLPTPELPETRRLMLIDQQGKITQTPIPRSVGGGGRGDHNPGGFWREVTGEYVSKYSGLLKNFCWCNEKLNSLMEGFKYIHLWVWLGYCRFPIKCRD